MATIGDRVTVTIHGPNVLSGTALTAMRTYALGQGNSMSAIGTIIEDLGDNWLVEFDSPLLGTKRMVVPKGRVT